MYNKACCAHVAITNEHIMEVRVRVIRERLSAPPGHVIGQGPAPGGGVVPCGGGGGGRGECTFLRYYDLLVKKSDFFK